VVTAPDIPGHRVGGVLGAGGFATVYRAWQLAVGRDVAVKVDNRALLTERDRRRFFREVTAAGRLSGHPHVIDVYDAGTLDDGRPYLVMELCPAGSLDDALRRNGPMPAGQVRDIGIRIADGLAAAHRAGVLHRDIKPANILVNRYGIVGLSDFGLASIIAAGGDQSASRDALTPAFSAPESFRGEDPTALADVYSLAATLYALLAGRPPRFAADGKTPSLATIISLHDKPVDDVPGTPPEFTALLRRSLSADPAARPQTAAAFRDALIGLDSHTGTAQYASPAQYAGSAQYASPAQYAGSAQYAGPAQYAGSAQYAGPAQHDGSGWYAGPVHLGEPITNRSGSRSDVGWTGAGPDPSSEPGTGPAGGLGRHAALEPAPARRRLVPWLIGLAAALVIIGAAVIIGVRLLPHKTAAGSGAAAAGREGGTSQVSTSGGTGGQAGGSAPVGTFGVATVRAGCPAASVHLAAARCPAFPECWAGLVEISGAVSAEPLPCSQPHYWETFAIAIMPADAQTFDQPTLAGNPTVRAVCSMPVLLASRRVMARQIPAGSWQIEVLPPTEAAFDSGARTFRCVANIVGTQSSTSQFRR